jgi:hypothetical protein
MENKNINKNVCFFFFPHRVSYTSGRVTLERGEQQQIAHSANPVPFYLLPPMD